MNESASHHFSGPDGNRALVLRNGLTQESRQAVVEGAYQRLIIRPGNYREWREVASDLRDVNWLEIESEDLHWPSIETLDGVSHLRLIDGLRHQMDFSRLDRLRSIDLGWSQGLASDCFRHTRLESMKLHRAPTADISELALPPTLTSLCLIDARKLIHLNGVEDITGLRELRIDGSPALVSVDALAQGSQIKTLEVIACRRLDRVAAIGSQIGLERLRLEKLPIERLDFSLELLARLTDLVFVGLQIDISATQLVRLHDLRSLVLDRCRLIHGSWIDLAACRSLISVLARVSKPESRDYQQLRHLLQEKLVS